MDRMPLHNDLFCKLPYNIIEVLLSLLCKQNQKSFIYFSIKMTTIIIKINSHQKLYFYRSGITKPEINHSCCSLKIIEI